MEEEILLFFRAVYGKINPIIPDLVYFLIMHRFKLTKDLVRGKEIVVR